MYFIQMNNEMKAGRLSLAWPVRGTAIHAGSKKNALRCPHAFYNAREHI